jgi:hypothetical protein
MDGSGVFTYDGSLPTAKDRMRHTLGDTDPSNPLRFDETYTATLAFYDDDETLATAKLARALAVQFGREATSISIPGGPSISYSDRVKAWTETAKSLESAIADAGGSGSTSYTGKRVSRPGMDVESVSEYRRGLDDYPAGGW